MVRTGSARRAPARAGDTRQALVDAAVEVLRHEGFAAATARTIAARAGCNQGLVFYYFGSVVALLLAALDEVSAQRRRRYDEALAEVHRPSELVELRRPDLQRGPRHRRRQGAGGDDRRGRFHAWSRESR